MKYLIFFLVFILCASCKNNKEEKLSLIKSSISVIKPSIIDSLKTTTEIENLIHLKDTNLKKFKLKRIQDFDRGKYTSYDEDSLTKVLARKLKVEKSFYKVDFDNNGFNDLLVIGDTEHTCSGFGVRCCGFDVFVLMNFGKDSSVIKSLTDDFHVSFVPKIKKYKRENLLSINKANRHYPNGKATLLIYKWNSFIEYHEKEETHKIEKIEFESFGYPKMNSSFTLIIDKDRKAILKDESFDNSKKGNEIVFDGQIENTKYIEITSLLNYIPFAELDKAYSPSGTSQPIIHLKITYNNGKIKQIDDYNFRKTYGLKRVYELLSELKTSQNWKKT